LQKVTQATFDVAQANGAAETQDLESLNRVRKASTRRIAQHCAKYRGGDTLRALGQIANTGVPLLALVVLMFWTASWSYWLTLLIAIPTGGLLVRVFIIQHDCGHGSFFPARWANDLVGRASSVLTFAPYGLWRREHAIHHAGSGHLERRGVGDIETLTVKEYRARAWWQRIGYRIYRNPAFLFLFGVPFYFGVLQRQPWWHGLPARDSWKSVMGLNVAAAAIYGLLGWFTGFGALLKVMVPIVFIASAIGGWLFFVQHQFEETFWAEAGSWDFQVAAIYGSSYYALPAWLNWITGNIGVHHVHHLNSMVPNYRLQECLNALPELKEINRLTLWQSLKCVRLTLWCEDRQKLVSFREARAPAQ
jgi:acyl-lipid omega-6 desaturase (Delta-12 desaturase)